MAFSIKNFTVKMNVLGGGLWVNSPIVLAQFFEEQKNLFLSTKIQ
jgi:hypothetical protein